MRHFLSLITILSISAIFGLTSFAIAEDKAHAEHGDAKTDSKDKKDKKKKKDEEKKEEKKEEAKPAKKKASDGGC